MANVLLRWSGWLLVVWCSAGAAQVGRFSHDASGNLSSRSNAVVAAPVILGQPVDTSVDSGRSATFGVAVADAAGTTFQWLLNGSLITGATTDNLTITNAPGVWSGNYSVIVSNISGVVTSVVARTYLNFDQVRVWGENLYFQAGVPAGLNQRALLLATGSNDVVSIAAGVNHNLALRSDHTALGWGANDFYQATVPPGLTNIVTVAGGETHSAVLLANGTVVAWGQNSSGQTNVPAGLSNVVSLAAGHAHNLALRTDGRVVAWGDNSSGQTNVPLGMNDIIAVAAGWSHSLALSAGGQVYAWGSNASGETNVPSFLTNVVAIAAGRSSIGEHSLALRRDGTVVGWGYNSYGQATPPANLSNVVAIAAGGLHSLALQSDGSIVAWGQNASGQTNIPVGLSNAVAIAAGNNHSVALIGAAAGVYKPVLLVPAAAVCVQDRPWRLLVAAKNFPASFSAGGLPSGISIDPVTGLISGIPTVAGLFIVNLSASNVLGSTQATLSLTVIPPSPRIYSRASAVAYTGNDVGFQILANNQPTSFAASGLPPGTTVDPVTGVIFGQPAAVGLFSATLTASNAYGIGTAPFTLDVRSVAAFGNNGSGQTNVPTGLSNVLAVVGGGVDTYALKTDGRVVGWGYNGNNQTNVPTAVSNVVDIAGGGSHALALRSDGTVVGWGYNGYGQSNAPPGLSNVVSVAAGLNHSLALKSDGLIVAWGDSTYGQGRVPPELGGVVAIASGDYHNLAVRAGGTMVVWGNNSNGQTNVPPGLSNVVAVAGGGTHSLALRSDGTVVAWGGNTYGQANVPAGLSNVVAIAAGQYHSVAQQANGNMVTWGLNTDGQSDAPDNLTNTVTVSAGKLHTVALSAAEPSVTGPMILNRKPMVGVMDKPFVSRVFAKNRPTYFAAPGLPPGLSIDSATGRIFGTPSADGIFPVTLSVGNGSGTNQVAITVYIIRPIPRIYSPTTLVAYSGNDFDYQILADNSPVNYTVSGLPPGLSGDTLSGDITGQPGAVGLFPVTLQAFNSYGTGSATLQLEIRTVAVWGSNNRGQTNPPVGLSNIVAIAGGGDTSYALRGDGRVVAWGDGVAYSQTNVPAGLSNVVGIAAGLSHVLALKANGTVTGWGYNGYQQANSPAWLSNAVGLACGYYHSLALRADGTVTAWGYNANGQTNVPAGLSNVVQVAAGGYYSMALRDDGTVRVWGLFTNVPAGLSNVIAIAGGNGSQLALKTDGTVVPWNGVTGVPTGLSNVVAIAAGGAFDLALRADGSIVGWGDNSSGQLNVPSGLRRAVAIEAGGYHTLALTLVPRPQLRIDRNDPNILVSWPLSLSAFALQSSGSLAPGGWTNLLAFPSVSGNSNYFTFPLSSGQRYFRLRRM